MQPFFTAVKPREFRKQGKLTWKNNKTFLLIGRFLRFSLQSCRALKKRKQYLIKYVKKQQQKSGYEEAYAYAQVHVCAMKNH